MTRILVVDDHPIIRGGLVGLINREKDMQVCGEADREEDATLAVEKLKPDVVVLDLMLHQKDGIETIRKWKTMFPQLQVLVLSAQDENVYAERVIRAGGRGFIEKNQAADEVLTAIRLVRAGKIYVSRQVAARSFRGRLSATEEAIQDISKLTNRELHVFQLIGSGLENRNVARKLNVSVKTVETHRENIKNKLNLPDSAALNARALRWVREGR
jgi:DNA-binding NarL/FixJ family response regulator